MYNEIDNNKKYMLGLQIYCVTDKKLDILENTPINLCSVNNKILNTQYLNCNCKDNIFYKEKNYSELTFHYWYWKNMLNENNNNWVGFSQKRRHWIKKNSIKKNINEKNFLDHLIFEPDPSWENFESIICEPIDISGVKKIKIIKRGWKNLVKNPSLLINRRKQNIKFHFDTFHGYGNLDKAIDMLDDQNKIKFREFVNSSTTYNPHIMVISKPKILNLWFMSLFKWLAKCEKIFGIGNLKGYDHQRLYAYLAERYLSFWFKQHTKSLEWPWVFYDASNE